MPPPLPLESGRLAFVLLPTQTVERTVTVVAFESTRCRPSRDVGSWLCDVDLRRTCACTVDAVDVRRDGCWWCV